MSTETITVVPASGTADVEQPPLPLAIVKQGAREHRVLEVNEALLPAYQKASTLQLTEAERNALMQPFRDDEIEIRPHDGVLYIAHIMISDRLCQVFGPGQFCTVRRREWIEGTRIYAEWVLLIRGHFIGESVGAMDYHPSNAKMNYSDALEGTRGECLRRIAAKELGCGSQVWRPSFCREWIAKYAEERWVTEWGKKKKIWARKGSTAPVSDTDPLQEPSQPLKTPPTASQTAKKATVEPVQEQGDRKMLLEALRKLCPASRWADLSAFLQGFKHEGKTYAWLLPNETIADDLPVDKLRYLVNKWPDMLPLLDAFIAQNDQVDGAEAEPEDYTINPGPEPAWKSHKFHFGKLKGVTLGEFASEDSRKFYGWVMNYDPAKGTDGKPKSPSFDDLALRKALDEAKAYMEAKP